MESSTISIIVYLGLLCILRALRLMALFSACLCVGMESAKLRLWDKVIQTGHHDDYETPLNIPLTTGKTKPPTQPRTNGLADAIARAATAMVNTINH